MHFYKVFNTNNPVLTEGAIVERVKSEFDVRLDKYINQASLIYSKPEILETLYHQYVRIAQENNLPIMLMTPTRRVNKERIEKSEFKDKNVIEDASLLLQKIRKDYPKYKDNILIGGLLGCKGDAYSAENKLSVKEAYEFHKNQAMQFINTEVDCLVAGIMPEVNEIIGMANALGDTKLPYIISFMLRKDGCLIDGTSIAEAIRIVDSEVNVKPYCYMTNCIHPQNLLLGLRNKKNQSELVKKRFLGIQANASTLSPEELNNCGVLQQGDFDEMIKEMELLYKKYNLKILGGCCGTNHFFIEKLSAKITEMTIE